MKNTKVRQPSSALNNKNQRVSVAWAKYEREGLNYYHGILNVEKELNRKSN